MEGIFFVILAGFLWAVDTLIRYPLLGTISAEKIVLIEHLFLTIIFLPLFLRHFKDFLEVKMNQLFSFLFIGVFGSAIGTLAFTRAFSIMNPSMVILLQKLQPIVAILLARFILGETIKKAFIFWAFLALIGGVFISSPDILNGTFTFDVSSQAIWGYIYTLIAVVSWGASTVFGKKLSANKFNEQQIMAGRFLFGFIFLVGYSYSWDRQFYLHLNMAPVIWGKLALMVFLSGMLGMYFYYRGLKKVSAKLCALLEMFFPLSAVTLNWIILGTKLTPLQLVGAGLLTGCSLIIQLLHL